MTERVIFEVSDELRARLAAAKFPEEVCGPSIEEKIAFLLDHVLCGVESSAATSRSIMLYRKFGLRHREDEDDDIDL